MADECEYCLGTPASAQLTEDGLKYLCAECWAALGDGPDEEVVSA